MAITTYTYTLPSGSEMGRYRTGIMLGEYDKVLSYTVTYGSTFSLKAVNAVDSSTVVYGMGGVVPSSWTPQTSSNNFPNGNVFFVLAKVGPISANTVLSGDDVSPTTAGNTITVYKESDTDSIISNCEICVGLTFFKRVSSTFSMLSNGAIKTNASVLFTITADVNSTCNLTVANGFGSGDYMPDLEVPIIAGSPPTCKVFDAWTGVNGIKFVAGGINTPYATIRMPASDTTVTATYRDKSAIGESAGRYNGSSWDAVEPYYFNGTDWVPCGIKYYDGSSWTNVDTY